MHATIEHTERGAGVLATRTVYAVTVVVTFTTHELAIIKRHKLGNMIVLKRDPPTNPSVFDYVGTSPSKIDYNLTINHLLRGAETYCLCTPLEAKQYDHRIRGALAGLKNYLQGNIIEHTKVSWFEVVNANRH